MLVAVLDQQTIGFFVFECLIKKCPEIQKRQKVRLIVGEALLCPLCGITRFKRALTRVLDRQG